jgi:hypothetical protein
MKKPPSKPRSKNKWMPQLEDATNFATIHWYAIVLEKLLIEMYCTNRKKWPALQKMLDQDMQDLYDYFKRPEFGPGLSDDDECPPGQQMCDDGLCAARCNAFD